jgi:5-methylcytosine-specific restriction endonuclease McrA
MHQRQKEAHELQVQSRSEALLAHDVLLSTLTSELRLAKEFHHLISRQLGFTDDMALGEGGRGDLAQLQADVVKCEAAVGEAKILLKSAN